MTGKPVAKTPDDVMVELAIEIAKIRGMSHFMNGIPQECYRQADKLLRVVVQPLIEAAVADRDDEWRDIVTTFITSSTKSMESRLSKIDKEEASNG